MTTLRTILAIGLILSVTALLPAAAEQRSAQDAERLDAAVELAIDHLAALDGLDRADVDEVIVTDVYTSEHNDVTHVYLRQAVDGLQVLGANATVNIQGDQVVHAAHRFLADVDQRTSGTAVLPAVEARRIAAAHVDGSLVQTTGAELAHQALTDGTVRLSWQVAVTTPQTTHHVAVDAQDGTVLDAWDITDDDDITLDELAARTLRPSGSDSAVEASTVTEAVVPDDRADDGSSYRVFPMPMENPGDGERLVVENPADARFSPFGWHDTDGVEGPEFTITRGNNTNTYADTIPEGLPDPLSQPDGGEGLDFDHDIPTYDQTPLVYRDAAVDNLFYWNNVMHDVTAAYGFTEAAGNFQATNYSGEGAGGDAVNAEAQDGSGVNNANFSTPTDGSPGRMQMYIWPRTDGSETRDGDLDAGIIAHEYGHGVSNRLVGGPNTGGCLSSHDERQGEGWSDYWSYVLTMREGDDGATPRGIGTYVLHQENRTGKGIRITPYSTDMTVNPATYNRISTAAEPHGVGYVWATYLWDLYWNLVDVHGFNPNPYDAWSTGGNNLAIQLTVDGMKFGPCEPGFVDARDAIIAADAALTDGENECLIWDTFARRGLGLSADQGNPANKTDGVEAYDVPEYCA